jgi:hypothetical protein
MKRTGIVIAALAALAMSALPMTASAQRASRGREAAAPALAAISKAQREQGMKEAPAAAAGSKVACTVSDAYFINATTNAETKAKLNFYEVACNEGMGYVLESSPEQTRAFNCLAIAAQAATEAAQGVKNPLTCRLEANADPKQGLAPMLTAAGRTCAITNARPMGATAAGENFFEAACDGGRGYVVKTAAPGTGAKAEVMDCAQFLGTQTECTLTTKAQIVASIGQLASQMSTPCTVSDARYVGSGSAGTYYEVACGAQSQGYMIQTNATTGAFQQAYECSKAQAIGGGCTLTNVEVSEQAEAATYTRLAKASGYGCDVSKYRFLGIDEKSKSEVVELACSNRPDGAIALFPTASGQKGQFYDCVTSAALGVGCNLSQASSTYAKYTAGLVGMGKSLCKVSNAKWLAATQSGQDMIETACSDGLPGFVMVVARADGKVAELLTCGQLRGMGVSCTMPTNTANAAAAAGAAAR